MFYPCETGKDDAPGRVFDTGVDEEEQLAVGKLTAMMKENALVAGRALDAKALLFLLSLEVAYNGINFGRAIGRLRVRRVGGACGGCAVHVAQARGRWPPSRPGPDRPSSGC